VAEPRSHVAWVESLSPWPAEFGLDRMRRLLAALGEPQQSFRAVHVVGTNGKGTTTRMVDELLSAGGLRVGSYYSPHVTGWAERVRVLGNEADLEGALARVRPAAELVEATQFEVLTAAAFAEFAAAGVEAAAVEAGLGGRLDATNVLDAPVVVLTNVGLEHTDVLGDTREAIAAEKLAVVSPGATVVLSEPEWEGEARRRGAEPVVVVTGAHLALAQAAAEALLGHAVDPAPAAGVRLPGRLERRGESPPEIWDGAHNPDGVAYLLGLLPPGDYVCVASVMRGKDVGAMLRPLARAGQTLVATSCSNPRALPAEELAAAATTWFQTIETTPDPHQALARARAVARGDGRSVLVTGSLYLLADLAAGAAAGG
jgi:dihydrofolate synthase/folylpolyglutamate synthase